MLIYQRGIPILVDFISMVIVDWFCHHCCTSFGYVAIYFGGSMQSSFHDKILFMWCKKLCRVRYYPTMVLRCFKGKSA